MSEDTGPSHYYSPSGPWHIPALGIDEGIFFNAPGPQLHHPQPRSIDYTSYDHSPINLLLAD